MKRRGQWWRGDTIVGPRGTEIDLTDGVDWITVKGATDKACEALAERLLLALNGASL